MPRSHFTKLLVLVALAFAAPGVARAVEFNAVWEASSATMPDSACPAWTTAPSAAVRQFVGGALRLQTSTCSVSASYGHTGADFVMPETLVVEARLRVLSGGECVGPCGHYRGMANLAITTAPGVGVLVHVGLGEVFVTTSECGGTLAATVPTTDAMHTYRVVVHGTTVRVHRDGVPVLTSSTYTSLADHGSSPRVYWGEASYLAYGTSDWEYVKHNGHATGCMPLDVPSPVASTLALRAWPSPSSGETRIAWTMARPARAHVAIFDAAGRRVWRLADADLGVGTHEVAWDGRDAGGRRVPPGAYLCRLEVAGEVVTRRILRAN